MSIMAKRPETAVCLNCVYFDRAGGEDEDEGECHRDPPDSEGSWPEVAVNNWCGHFCDDWENRRHVRIE